jgi:hypothetical protein
LSLNPILFSTKNAHPLIEMSVTAFATISLEMSVPSHYGFHSFPVVD